MLARQAECGIGSFPRRCLLRPPPGAGTVRAGCGQGYCDCPALLLCTLEDRPLGRHDAPPWEVFTDAAPEGSGFRVGIVEEKGFCRSLRRPPWIDSLQQVELFAVYVVTKLASYRGCESVRIGFDSDVARSQVNALRASVGSVKQQRIPRRVFGLGVGQALPSVPSG